MSNEEIAACTKAKASELISKEDEKSSASDLNEEEVRLMVSRRELEFYEMCEEVRRDRELKEQISKLPPEIQQALRELRQAANGYRSKGGGRR